MKYTIFSFYGVNISKPPKKELLGYFPSLILKTIIFHFSTTIKQLLEIIITDLILMLINLNRFLDFRFYTKPTFLSIFLIRADFLQILYVYLLILLFLVFSLQNSFTNVA